MNQRLYLVVAALLIGGCVRGSLPPTAAALAPSVAVVEVEGLRVGKSDLVVGVTHTQHSADQWGDREATASAVETLQSTVRLQNQHIMGWGALNPEPAPGAYDFTSLDHRIELVHRSGGTPVITLCCSPDWMKGGVAGETDWSSLNDAPTPGHYRDFAQLAATVALRYPEVRFFQVWNEMKGFYDVARNRWNYEGYTSLYNDVYRAVKAVRPDALLGGPYVKMESFPDSVAQSDPSTISGTWGVLDQRSLDAIDYWFAHKAGADFITVDGTTAAHDETPVGDEFDATTKFAAVNKWIRSRTTLPIWWAEWPVQPEHSSWDEQHEAAVLTTALAQMAVSGASVALLWQPQGLGKTCRGCLWTDTATPGGGRAGKFAAILRAFARAFPRGTPLVTSTSSSAEVFAFASPSTIVLVNRSSWSRSVVADGQLVRLGRYGVQFLDR